MTDFFIWDTDAQSSFENSVARYIDHVAFLIEPGGMRAAQVSDNGNIWRGRYTRVLLHLSQNVLAERIDERVDRDNKVGRVLLESVTNFAMGEGIEKALGDGSAGREASKLIRKLPHPRMFSKESVLLREFGKGAFREIDPKVNDVNLDEGGMQGL